MRENLTEKKLKEYFYRIDDFTKNHLEICGIDRKDLCENGEVYYMNGNDGTLFDIECNNRLCEFMTFYKDGEQTGASKVCLYTDGSIEGYFYKEKDDIFGDSLEKFQKKDFFKENEFIELLTFLYFGTDKIDIYDEKIRNIDSVFDNNHQLNMAKKSLQNDNQRDM